MTEWRSVPMDVALPGAGRMVRVALRAIALGLVAFTGLAILLALRLIERPVFGERRPWSPYITQAVCKIALWIIGLRVTVHGRPAPGATISNHVSWLDIFVLNAHERVYFVAKAEVAGWAFIGWLARATGTLFIERKTSEAKVHQQALEQRLAAGQPLLFFPEGTSSDGMRVLPFKSTLFAAFFQAGSGGAYAVQPVTLVYHAPAGQDPRFYGWWGNAEFVTSFRDVLGQSRQGRVDVIYHPALQVRDFRDRKSLAAACEAAIRAGHPYGHMSEDQPKGAMSA